MYRSYKTISLNDEMFDADGCAVQRYQTLAGEKDIDTTSVDTADTRDALPPHLKAVANAIANGNNPIESVKLAFACSDREANRLISKLRRRWLELTNVRQR